MVSSLFTGPGRRGREGRGTQTPVLYHSPLTSSILPHLHLFAFHLSTPFHLLPSIRYSVRVDLACSALSVLC